MINPFVKPTYQHMSCIDNDFKIKASFSSIFKHYQRRLREVIVHPCCSV